jgi:hypothetical protein
MKLPRRKFLHLAAGIAAVPVMARIARAQAYPTGPVRLIVGFPAGGTNDVHARLIADWLSKQFGRSFVVENRPGATGNIAQLSDRRNRPGVSPITARKFSVRRLWLENPAAHAISAIERSVSRRSSSARRTRLPVRNRCGDFPTQILKASPK